MTENNIQIKELAEGILRGDNAKLSRAITFIESSNLRHKQISQEILKELLPHTGNSIRIGISGAPGAGKSTFIDKFGTILCQKGKKVAVLAIDPSSSISKGAILGDKTRMENLSIHQNSFIRPSPTSGTLGGVGNMTRESVLLCEAAGYDVIFIETVGVGQSEITVRTMCDIFLLLLLPSAGDELQGIKKGIVEISDFILINKSDGGNMESALRTKADYESAVHYISSFTDGWQPKVMNISVIENIGLVDLENTINEFEMYLRSSNILSNRRREQLLNWFDSNFENQLKSLFFDDNDLRKMLNDAKNDILNDRKTVYSSVLYLIDEFKKAIMNSDYAK